MPPPPWRPRRWVAALRPNGRTTGALLTGLAALLLSGFAAGPDVSTSRAAASPAPSSDPRADFRLSGSRTQGGLLIGTVPIPVRQVLLDGVAIPVAPDGRFVIAFDRDAAPHATLETTFVDGTAVRETLDIAPRAWDVSRLTTLPKIPLPQPEFDRVRPAELAQIVAARQVHSDAQGWRQTFLWPTTGRISTLFGSQRIYANGVAGSYHSGLDVAKPTGSVILAPADGVVILAADHPFSLEGNLLMIDHGMGLNSAFLHLSRIDVRVGDHVRRGQPIALSGATGRATGPHLHWSLRWGDAKIDPLLVAGPMPTGEDR